LKEFRLGRRIPGLLKRARDRSGIFCARKKLERIARFFAAGPQKMRRKYLGELVDPAGVLPALGAAI
jgi:hypothetical protein